MSKPVLFPKLEKVCNMLPLNVRVAMQFEFMVSNPGSICTNRSGSATCPNVPIKEISNGKKRKKGFSP